MTTNVLSASPSTNQIDDIIPPVLDVISPNSTESINETKILVKLEAFDETGWQDLTIKIDNVILFQVNNTPDIVDSEGLQYNETHLSFERLINLNNQENLQTKVFSITIRDLSDNTDSISLQIISDIEVPIIIWLNPLENQIVENTTLLISWQVFDESPIKYQKLRLNGETIMVLEGNNTFAIDNVFTISTTFPELKPGSTFYTIELIVIDLSNNTTVDNLAFIFNNNIAQDRSNDSQTEYIQILILFFTSITILMILIKLLYPLLIVKKRKKSMIQDLYPPPLLEIIHVMSRSSHSKVLEMTDIFFSLENDWNSLVKQSVEGQINKTELTDMIDIYVSNLLLEAVSIAGSDFTVYTSCENLILKWKKTLFNKPTPWKGELDEPPLEKIIVWLEAMNLINQNQILNKIDKVKANWSQIKSQISNLEDPTVNEMRKILGDYKSELMILTLWDEKISEQQKKPLDELLNKWVSGIIN